MSLEVRFRVKCSNVYPYQYLFVVGDCEALGNWQPTAALKLTADEKNRDTWEGKVTIPNNTLELHFRYFIGYLLDAATEGSVQQIIVSRWEAALNPRKCMPVLEASKAGIVRENYTDDFGQYGGKELVADGWIGHANEHVVLLRIHGEALKFYKQKFKKKETRLKVVPFDVRFKETFCPYDWRQRQSSVTERARGILWRLSSVYVRTRDTIEEEATDEEKDPVLPDVPSFSKTELSVLTREDPIFGEQYVNGSVFRNDVDYLVFRTKTVSIEHLAFRIELYHEKQRVAMAYALPATLPDTYGKSTFPIICNQHMPVGQLDVDYMLLKPLALDRGLINRMDVTFGRYWRKRKALEIGHRGMGNSYTKIACERENTIQSLKQAAKKGADLVEFDVQLTKDMQPVIYHDFHVLVEVAHRTGTLEKITEDVHHQMAIKDLKLTQLNLLHFEHVHVKMNGPSTTDCEKVIPTKAELSRSLEQADANDEDYNPFPSLESALKLVNEHVGFNIEVKYPMQMKDGTHECQGYFERNQYVDTILKTVFAHAGRRRILFSCFDPDVCTLLAQKQHRFPVLFLVVGTTTRYMPFSDIRSDCSKMAIHYAAANGLLGVNFHSEELLHDKNPLKLAEKYQLVSFVWGDDLNQKQHQEYFRMDLKVDGLIYDRIGEFEQRQNVFLVEKSAREALFSKSPAPSRTPSRRNSMERDTTMKNGTPPKRETSLGPRRYSQEM